MRRRRCLRSLVNDSTLEFKRIRQTDLPLQAAVANTVPPLRRTLNHIRKMEKACLNIDDRPFFGALEPDTRLRHMQELKQVFQGVPLVTNTCPYSSQT